MSTNLFNTTCLIVKFINTRHYVRRLSIHVYFYMKILLKIRFGLRPWEMTTLLVSLYNMYYHTTCKYKISYRRQKSKLINFKSDVFVR